MPTRTRLQGAIQATLAKYITYADTLRTTPLDTDLDLEALSRRLHLGYSEPLAPACDAAAITGAVASAVHTPSQRAVADAAGMGVGTPAATVAVDLAMNPASSLWRQAASQWQQASSQWVATSRLTPGGAAARAASTGATLPQAVANSRAQSATAATRHVVPDTYVHEQPGIPSAQGVREVPKASPFALSSIALSSATPTPCFTPTLDCGDSFAGHSCDSSAHASPAPFSRLESLAELQASAAIGQHRSCHEPPSVPSQCSDSVHSGPDAIVGHTSQDERMHEWTPGARAASTEHAAAAAAAAAGSDAASHGSFEARAADVVSHAFSSQQTLSQASSGAEQAARPAEQSQRQRFAAPRPQQWQHLSPASRPLSARSWTVATSARSSGGQLAARSGGNPSAVLASSPLRPSSSLRPIRTVTPRSADLDGIPMPRASTAAPLLVAHADPLAQHADLHVPRWHIRSHASSASVQPALSAAHLRPPEADVVTRVSSTSAASASRAALASDAVASRSACTTRSGSDAPPHMPGSGLCAQARSKGSTGGSVIGAEPGLLCAKENSPPQSPGNAAEAEPVRARCSARTRYDGLAASVSALSLHELAPQQSFADRGSGYSFAEAHAADKAPAHTCIGTHATSAAQVPYSRAELRESYHLSPTGVGALRLSDESARLWRLLSPACALVSPPHLQVRCHAR